MADVSIVRPSTLKRDSGDLPALLQVRRRDFNRKILAPAQRSGNIAMKGLIWTVSRNRGMEALFDFDVLQRSLLFLADRSDSKKYRLRGETPPEIVDALFAAYRGQTKK